MFYEIEFFLMCTLLCEHIFTRTLKKYLLVKKLYILKNNKNLFTTYYLQAYIHKIYSFTHLMENFQPSCLRHCLRDLLLYTIDIDNFIEKTGDERRGNVNPSTIKYPLLLPSLPLSLKMEQ